MFFPDIRLKTFGGNNPSGATLVTEKGETVEGVKEKPSELAND